MNTTPSDAREQELVRLEVLRAFKVHFGRDAKHNLSPFSRDQIIGYGTNVGDSDIPEIHAAIRKHIRTCLTAVHQDNGSQIVMLIGGPGMGKSHLLNYFRAPKPAEELGYLLAGNSNHWRADEFEACLLDWILEALLRPTPDGPHLLLEKVQDVAFQALTQLLGKPDQMARVRKGVSSSVFGRWWSKLARGSQSGFERQIEQRNPRVFRRLNFGRFARYVCSRFLHQSGHPFHRYVLHVLLRYLFEEDREVVRAWLRRRPVGENFLRKLGIHDEIDQNYKIMETIKILLSLFAPDVSRGLSQGNGRASRPLVFLLAFDQAEGRDALFERDEEWMKFFAQLSELYNTLPNVFIVFTMTLDLSKRLHPRMEGQFQDRIRRDQRFVLHEIEDREVLALYRRHIETWLQGAPEGVWSKVEALEYFFAPFDRATVLELTRGKSLRDMLRAFDDHFCGSMDKIVIVDDPVFDYRVAQKQQRQLELIDNPYSYTKDHLRVVMELFEQFGSVLAQAAGFEYSKVVPVGRAEMPHLLELYFHARGDSSCWVRVFLCRLSFRWRRAATACLELLAYRQRNKNLLVLIRNNDFSFDFPEARKEQILSQVFSPAEHTDIQALLRVLANRPAYQANAWTAAEKLFCEQLRPTYVGKLLTHIREALQRQGGDMSASVEADEAVEPHDVDEAAANVVSPNDMLLLEAIESE